MSLGKKKMLHQAADSGVVNTENFSTVLYTGNGGTQSITGVGFQPDLVWGKARTDAISNILFDSVRGENKQLSSNTTSAEVVRGSDAYLFDSNGFTVTTVGNLNNTEDYVAWCWKAGGAAVTNNDGSITSTVSANPDAGFSIVKYTGGGDVNVGHGLSSAPDLIISKITNVGGSWVVYNSISGTGKYLVLNDSASIATASEVFSAVTDTTFTHNWSGNSYSYIAYCFHSVDGYQKIGSYTATSPSVSVDVGFPPRFVLLKSVDNAGQWLVVDSERGGSNGQDRARLFANLSSAEGADTTVDFTGNTFSVQFGSVGNQNSGSKYIYLAIA